MIVLVNRQLCIDPLLINVITINKYFNNNHNNESIKLNQYNS